jgi:hypothetical protein
MKDIPVLVSTICNMIVALFIVTNALPNLVLVWAWVWLIYGVISVVGVLVVVSVMIVRGRES